MAKELTDMKAGFIGTGKYAAAHARSLERIGANITACYGTNREKTASFADAFGCRIFENPMDVVSRSEIDVLYLVVPACAYDGRWELAAVDEAIPFLCEKPVSLDLSAARTVSRAVEKAGLVTSSGFLLRQGAAAAEAKRVINRNEISIVRASRMQGMPRNNWFHRMEKSGGIMVEAGIHTVDFMRWVFGEIESVHAVTAAGICSKRHRDCNLYDSMDAQLIFESGVVGDLAVSCILENGASKLDFLDVFGRDFMLTFDSPWDGSRIRYKEGADEWVELTIDAGRHDLHNRNFLQAAADGSPEKVVGDYPDAVKSLEAVLAMNRSAETGAMVSLKDMEQPSRTARLNA